MKLKYLKVKYRIAFLVFFLAVSLPVKGEVFDSGSVYGEYLLEEESDKISMDLEGAYLVDVLKAFSKETGLNFVASEAVSELRLTLYFKEVPVKDAFETIISSNNLEYKYFPDASIFFVKEKEDTNVGLETKVYELKHLRFPDSRIQQEINAFVGGEEGGAGGAAGGEESSGMSIIDAVRELLTARGRLVPDKRNNALIVIDVPNVFPKIDKLVKRLDVPLTKVLIETEILDVNKSAVDDLGVKFAKLNDPEENANYSLMKLAVPGTRDVSFPFTGMSGEPASGDFTASELTVLGTNLVLKFLKTRSDTKVIARPKIMTLAQETAQIKIVRDEAIGIKVEDTGSEEEGAQQSIEIERAETGTTLRVTPYVDEEDKNITLFVSTRVSDAVDSEFQSGSSLITGTIKNPEDRTTSNYVRLKDGETLLLGGLIRTEKSVNKGKVPVLSDIPVLGALFRWKATSDIKRELLIFLTPRIVKDLGQEGGEQKVDKRILKRRERRGVIDSNTVSAALDAYSRD